MKHVLIAVVAALLVATIGSLQADPVDAQAGTVKITISYTGKGKVDATHKLWVWLFDSPNIGPASQPVAQLSLDTNGADAVFDAVAGDKIYVAVAFDEQGVMQGDAPPPPGTPIGILAGPEGAPMPVAPGAKGVARLTFDDTNRMP